MDATGYTMRAAAWDDLVPAAEVLAADDLADAGEVVLDRGFLRGQWEQAGFDPLRDAWVAADDAGTVVGYAQATRDHEDIAEAWGVVHPAHRGRGLGAALLRQTELRAGDLMAGVPDARLRHSVNAGDEAAAALLGGRGFHLVRHFWHMRIALPGRPDPGPAPSGITITPVRPPDDLPAAHAVLDEAFADDWDHHPEPFDRWREDWTQDPDYDPALWRLAWDAARPVGALAAVVRGDQGWVTLLGVRAEARGRGVASALLHHAFAAFAARGIRLAVLVVDAANPSGATVLYERVGMQIVKRFDVWERGLSGGGASEDAPR